MTFFRSAMPLAAIAALLAGCEEPTPLDCPGVFSCAESCTDEFCIDACISRATPQALQLAQAVAVCSKANNCSTSNCLAVNCPNEVNACRGFTTLPDSGMPGGGAGDGGTSATPTCVPTNGVPELTAPLSAINASYAGGTYIDPIISVDGDTRRVRLAVYDYANSTRLLQNWAEDVTGPTTVTAHIPAGVKGSMPDTYYLWVELCSTSICTLPTTITRYSHKGTAGVYTETRSTNPTSSESTCRSPYSVVPFTVQ